MQIFDWNRHSTEWFTQRGETRQCVLFVHRSYVLLHSTFHRRCLAGIFTVHQSSAIIENALKVQMQIFVRTFFDRNRLQKRVHRSYVLSSTFHRRCSDDIFTPEVGHHRERVKSAGRYANFVLSTAFH